MSAVHGPDITDMRTIERQPRIAELTPASLVTPR